MGHAKTRSGAFGESREFLQSVTTLPSGNFPETQNITEKANWQRTASHSPSSVILPLREQLPSSYGFLIASLGCSINFVKGFPRLF